MLGRASFLFASKKIKLESWGRSHFKDFFSPVYLCAMSFKNHTADMLPFCLTIIELRKKILSVNFIVIVVVLFTIVIVVVVVSKEEEK